MITKIIALLCVIVAAPLGLLALAWLPASILSIGHYASGVDSPGTPSFHASMVHGLRYAVESSLIRASALLVFGLLVRSVTRWRRPDSHLMWGGVLLVAIAHLVSFTFEHPVRPGYLTLHQSSPLVIFWGLPAVVATLAAIALVVAPRTAPGDAAPD